MGENQPGNLSPDSNLPAPDSTCLIEEPPEDSDAPAPRLAGVGAALGSCFSVMIVVLVVGSAGTISRPHAGLAADMRESTTLPAPRPAELTSEGNTPIRRMADPVVSIESRLRLETMGRAAMLARAEAEAAESRLAMRCSALEHRALERAERERTRAEQVESHGSPYEWMTTEQLATRTRYRARSQLDADLSTVNSLRVSAEGELARLREAADAAESAVAMARAGLAATAEETAPAASKSTSRLAAAGGLIQPAATVQADLRGLISRHHASLVEAISSAVAGD